MNRYVTAVKEILDEVIATQQATMEKTIDVCAEAMMRQKNVFFFGTGHSHMLAEEPFYRAGGLVPIKPILEPALMLHEGGVKSTKLERMEGYADILLEQHGVGEGDVLFVISNSGINVVPVEMALGAKQRGARVIALTNLKQSEQANPRHASQKKLYEIAHLSLNNCGVIGDAAVDLDSSGTRVGPTSTVIGAFIINSIVVGIADRFIAENRVPPLYVSANVEHGDDHNKRLMNQYGES